MAKEKIEIPTIEGNVNLIKKMETIKQMETTKMCWIKKSEKLPNEGESCLIFLPNLIPNHGVLYSIFKNGEFCDEDGVAWPQEEITKWTSKTP